MGNFKFLFTKNTYIFITIIICTLAFYLLDQYAISNSDDYIFKFMIQPEYKSYLEIASPNVERAYPIESVKDALISTTHGYFSNNGRFLLHVIIQSCVSLMSMNHFVIINSLIFAIFLFSFFHLTIDKKNAFQLLLASFAIWLFIPWKGFTFLSNVSLSINYLWTATAYLLFYILYLKIREKERCSIINYVILFLIGAIVGSLQESFSLGFAGAFFLYYIFNIKKINRPLLFLLIGFYIGVSFNVLAPSNFNRQSGVGFIHFNYLISCCSSPAIVLCFLSLIYFTITDKLYIKEKLKDNLILVLSIFVNMSFAFIVAYGGRHSLTSVSVFSLILLFKLWMPKAFFQKKHTYISVALLVVIMITYIPVYLMREKSYNSYNTFISQIGKNEDGIYYQEDYDDCVNKINSSLFYSYFILVQDYKDAPFYHRLISLIVTNGQSNLLIKEVRGKK